MKQLHDGKTYPFDALPLEERINLLKATQRSIIAFSKKYAKWDKIWTIS